MLEEVKFNDDLIITCAYRIFDEEYAYEEGFDIMKIAMGVKDLSIIENLKPLMG